MSTVLTLRLAGTFLPERQARIVDLSPGDPVLLLREPTNPYDRNAIVAVGPSGEKIGYIPRPIAAEMAPILDAVGEPHPGFIDNVWNRDVEETPLVVDVICYEPSAA